MIFSLLLFFMPSFAFGAQESIVINEIAWMGTDVSTNNEWMELYNQTNSDINLNGWKLETQDGKLKVTLAGSIGAKGFFLLERTNDKTLPDVKADQIYAGALANSGEVLILKNQSGQEVDRVDASQGWPAGDGKTKETMQRSGDSWITAEGTPRKENHSGVASGAPLPQTSAPPQASSSPAASENSPQSKESTPAAPSDAAIAKQPFSVQPEPVKIVPEDRARWSRIYINEFLPNPKGADEQGEWIELYNDGESSVSLAGLLLDDDEGGSNPYHIPAGTTIAAKGFLVFPRAQTKIALNTAGDAVRLMTPGGSVLARVSYVNAKEDEAAAYDIAKNAFFWTKHPTKGAQNTLTAKIVTADTKGGAHQANTVNSPDALPSMNVNDLNANASAQNHTQGSSSSDTSGWLVWGAVLLCGVGAALAWKKWGKAEL